MTEAAEQDASSPNFVERTRCPVCGGTGGTEIYRSSFLQDPLHNYLDTFYGAQGTVEWDRLEGADFILIRCPNCKLIYQRDIFNDEMLTRLYEVWIDPERARRRSHVQKDSRILHAYASRITAAVELLGAKPQALHFHDFGMGWGHWLLAARVLGCRVSGSETSDERIHHAASLGIEVVPWERLPGSDFDYINTEKVFEHLPRPLDTLRHLASALRPGGLMRVSVPDCYRLLRRLRVCDWTAPKGSKNSLNDVSPLEHVNCFRRSTIIRMGALAGLRPVAVPLGIRVAHGNGTNPLVNLVKELVRPAYQSILDRNTDVLFRKSD